MIFILIRIFPFVFPVIYLALLKMMFVLGGAMTWLLTIALLINFIYFLFIYFKTKNSSIFIFLFHSFILVLTGFSYVLILGSEIFINLFLVVWALLYFLYLESIFHYFYETKKVIVLDLKNIIAYINLISFFLLTAFLINIHIFINFSVWLVYLGVAVTTFVLVLSRLKINNIDWRRSLLYSLLLSIMIIEVLVAVLFLSVSFYVLAVILTILYYILSSVLVLSVNNNLTKTILWQYVIFTLISIFIIAITSQWL